MESPIAVANYFIQKSFDTGKLLTPMKLVKLVYIAHGWHLALYDEPLLDEGVQAWMYGPVVNSVYHAFKSYGNGQITSLKSVLSGGRALTPQVTENIKPFLDKIWDVYGDLNGLQLSTLTHQPQTPWDIVWNQQGGKDSKSAIIANDTIKEHYKKKVHGETNVRTTVT
jgi:uncharacterized phage-associated protein